MISLAIVVVILVSSLVDVGLAIETVSTADVGGNQGWGLGFHGPDQYASVSSFFTASQYWPQQNITGTRQRL